MKPTPRRRARYLSIFALLQIAILVVLTSHAKTAPVANDAPQKQVLSAVHHH